jgi:hypothetical protein
MAETFNIVNQQIDSCRCCLSTLSERYVGAESSCLMKCEGVAVESKFRSCGSAEVNWDRRGLAQNGKRSAAANGERELRAEMR